ncbi:hypothetical protein KY289_013394 [Solanum tuberosum]|nr:hypothetical protein KY289_013394 [Solanum tuberosum]
MEPFQHTRHIQKYKRRLGMQYANYNQNDGDFNVISIDEEKIGGLHFYPQEYEDFAFCVNSCELFDINFKGSPFTWWNGRDDVECIFKRLDRLMINQFFLGLYGNVELEHLARTWSDHGPMKRKRLQVKRILKRDGVWTNDVEEVATEAVAFFQDLFTDVENEIELSLIENIPTLVTDEDNTMLNASPIVEEIKKVVFELNSDSASGPDGFTGHFYQVCWDFVGRDVVNVVEAFFNGFNSLVADKVCRLVANNWYSVLINGQAHGFFHFSRGVEQGDPLSPTLFILAAEVLSRALNNLFHNQDFTRYGMPKWSDVIYNLAYADDTVIFIIAEKKSLDLVMERLGIYEDQSGQMINKEKSCFYVLFAKFLWNSKEEGRSKQWISWYDICRHKEEGGLSFRSLFDMSKAMFAKLW